MVWAVSSWAGAKVELFPAVGTPSQVVLAGRVLKHAPNSSPHSTLTKNLRRLTASGLENSTVEVRLEGRVQSVRSGKDGEFTATFDAGAEAFSPGLHQAEAAISAADSASSATVEIIAEQAPFLVISDFDDTLAQSHAREGAKLLATALFEDETTQSVVDGMPAFYRCLRESSQPPGGFALVSGSPVGFSGRIDAFLRRHAFPPFGLSLRALSPSTLSNYKQPLIRGLLARFPQKVLLVGDSGEKDPEVYAQIRSEHPDRILGIYIRNAGGNLEPRRFTGMVLFDRPAQAAFDAAARGFAAPQCVEDAFSRGGADAGP
jgi:phosphatidate phosphatase APP1